MSPVDPQAAWNNRGNGGRGTDTQRSAGALSEPIVRSFPKATKVHRRGAGRVELLASHDVDGPCFSRSHRGASVQWKQPRGSRADNSFRGGPIFDDSAIRGAR